MDIHRATPLLAGLSPQQFMQRHWQKKPLLIRQAIADFTAPLSRAELFALAASADVESRLVMEEEASEEFSKASSKKKGARDGAAPDWTMQHGPFARRALPALTRPNWSLLVQGVDTHDARVADLLQQFRFVPDARVDDVMVSYASPGGGVGPHFDSYDVFLLQAHGSRRWRIGQQKDLTLRAGVPLKILANFEFEEEFVLHPGDMLYLPPRYAHEGVAVDECMTYSIGFRAPERRSLGVELLQRMLDEYQEDIDGDRAEDLDETQGDGADDGDSSGMATAPVLAPILYRDAKQAAVAHPAEIPATMQLFAEKAMADVLAYARHVPRWLGEQMTEPKPKTVFQATKPYEDGAVRLDGATRMLYDARHVYINGEGFRAAGADARLMRKLADQRALDARDMARASEDARNLVADWCDAGWVHGSV